MNKTLLESAQIDQFKKQVEEILAKLILPEEVARVIVDYKEDSDGQPSIFLSFELKADAILKKDNIARISRQMTDVSLQIIQSGVPWFPYTSLEEAA